MPFLCGLCLTLRMLHLDTITFSVMFFSVLLASHADVTLLAEKGFKVVPRDYLFLRVGLLLADG